MGITKFSYDLLQFHGGTKAGLRMLELGDQNLYFAPFYGQYAKPLFYELGIDHVSVDLSAHEGGAIKLDLCQPIYDEFVNSFDVVTNFGTSEHCADLYQVFRNVHYACKEGGLMFHENPKSGHWPGHGFHYMSEEFYTELARLNGYEILELGQHAAMGNAVNGINIYCVLRKTSVKFMSRKAFEKLPYHKQ